MSHVLPFGNIFRPTPQSQKELERALNHEVAENLDDFGVSAKKPADDDTLDLDQVMELNRLTNEIEPAAGLLDAY
mgnify:FL=1